MRKIISMLVIILVIAGIAPFILPLKNGEPLLKWSDISIPNLPELPEIAILKGDTSTSVTTYKWRDAEAVLHFTDSPPDGVSYQTITVDPNTNVIQSIRPSAPAQQTVSETTRRPAVPPAYSPTTAYDPAKVSEILDSARNIDKILQQRKEQQDKLLKAY